MWVAYAGTGIFPQWKNETETVDEETVQNTIFMWEQLKNTILREWLLPQAGQLTVMSDRGTSILKGLSQSLPHADVVYGAQHLMCDVNTHWRGKHSLPKNKMNKRAPYTETMFWKVVNAQTLQLHQQAMSDLSEHNETAAAYLRHIPHVHWALYAQCTNKNKDIDGSRYQCVRIYNHNTNNFTESENARMKSNLARSGNPCSLYSVWPLCGTLNYTKFTSSHMT
eukprot:765922-Hanusia_phi.AAC.1